MPAALELMLSGDLAGYWGVAALVLARSSGLAWTAPAWGTAGLGWRLRLALAALVTAVVAPVVGPGLETPTAWAALGWSCAVEVAVGAALGMAAALIVAGARQAGEVVGMQAGLSAASLLDPEAGSELNPIGHLYGLLALGTFLALGGPLTLVEALAESYRAVPAGAASATPEVAVSAVARVGWALALAVRAAAPAALALVLASLALGLLGRAAGALPLGGLTWPARAAVGLVLVLLGLAGTAAALAAAWQEWAALGIGG